MEADIQFALAALADNELGVFFFNDSISPLELNIQSYTMASTMASDFSCLVQSAGKPVTYGPQRHRRWPTDPHNYRQRR